METTTKRKVDELIQELLGSVEEEDVGIHLLTTYYRDESELYFFEGQDRDRVWKILNKLSEDSIRHKMILKEIIARLGVLRHGD